jgi:hypothetical protein
VVGKIDWLRCVKVGIDKMPVTRSQSSQEAQAANTLLSFRCCGSATATVTATRYVTRSSSVQQAHAQAAPVSQRPRREAAVRAREQLKLYIETDDE